LEVEGEYVGMSPEALIVVNALAAYLFLDRRYLEILPKCLIFHIPRCVGDCAKSLGLEPF
jgi:hypothetical protein